jgi:hypothetical protein
MNSPHSPSCEAGGKQKLFSIARMQKGKRSFLSFHKERLGGVF